MIFVGADWAEAHHDVAVKNTSGEMLAKRRIPEGVEGIRQFHELVAPLVDRTRILVGQGSLRSIIVLP